MTYNVFSGTLSLTQSIMWGAQFFEVCLYCVLSDADGNVVTLLIGEVADCEGIDQNHFYRVGWRAAGLFILTTVILQRKLAALIRRSGSRFYH